MQLSTPLRISACALLATHGVLQAQQNPDIIVTATGAEQYSTDVGSAVSVLDTDTILARQTLSLADILGTLPGVNVSRSGGAGQQTSLRIRGAESDQTLVLIDGVRVNDPSTPDGSFDFGNLLAGNIERVEILRGANSVAWGSQAIGGVVYVTTQRPNDQVKANISAEYGANESRRATAGASGKLGPLGLAIGGGYYQTDGISAFASGSERDPYRQYGANGRLELAISDEISTEASLYYSNSRVANDSVFPPFSSDDNTLSRSQELYGQVAAKLGLLGGRWQNSFRFALADINRSIVNPFFTAAPQGRSERFAYQGDFTANSAIRMIFGAERENSRYTDPDSGSSGSTAISSIYLQTIFSPSEKLTMTAGVRHDDHRDFGGNTSLSANAIWRVGENGPRLRASYAEGFRAPSLIDLDGSPFGFGTPDLRPERAKSYEAGIDWASSDGRFTAGLTGFRRNVRDQIAFAACPTPPDPAPQVCLNGNRPFGTTLNIERTRVSGIEAAFTVQPSEALRFDANYTWLDARNRSPGSNLGNRLARRPDHSLYTSVSYTTAFGLALSADAQLAGDSFDDLANSRRLDGYALFGLRSSFALTNALEIYGRIENLFDTEYQTATDFGTYGRSAFVGVRGRF